MQKWNNSISFTINGIVDHLYQDARNGQIHANL
jgi:hypothetical protein